MTKQGIAFINRDGQIGWAHKEDFVNFSKEVKDTFAKTAFFWMPQEDVSSQTYQQLAEKSLNYNPFQGLEISEEV